MNCGHFQNIFFSNSNAKSCFRIRPCLRALKASALIQTIGEHTEALIHFTVGVTHFEKAKSHTVEDLRANQVASPLE